MKEALIIFIILLVLLTIISVFGGSIRYTPSSPSNWQTFANSPSSSTRGFSPPKFVDPSRQTFLNESATPSTAFPPPPVKSSPLPTPPPILSQRPSAPTKSASPELPSASEPAGTENFASF